MKKTISLTFDQVIRLEIVISIYMAELKEKLEVAKQFDGEIASNWEGRIRELNQVMEKLKEVPWEE